MLNKITALATAVVIALAFASSADAKQGNKGAHVNKSMHVSKSAHVNKSVHVRTTKHYVVGRSYNGHIWYGHHRHRWHGVWYDYGVGPCWIFDDGLWFWNELACGL